jgi:hypothetical protein
LPERFRVDCAFGGGVAALSHSRRNYSLQAARLASPSSLRQIVEACRGHARGRGRLPEGPIPKTPQHQGCVDFFYTSVLLMGFESIKVMISHRMLFMAHILLVNFRVRFCQQEKKGPILTSWNQDLQSPFKNPHQPVCGNGG